MKKEIFALFMSLTLIMSVFAQENDWFVFNTANSGLSDNSVSVIKIDKKGNKWLGTYNNGLVKFDGKKWTAYNKDNSIFPDKSVRSIAIDSKNNKWIGTRDNGLVVFDDKKFTLIDSINSKLPSNWITSIAIDNNDVKWLGTRWKGIVKYDNKSFVLYDSLNSQLPSCQVWCVSVDKEGTVWAGTTGGLVKILDNGSMVVYNTSNSGILSNRVWSIFVDKDNNKWLGCENGVIKFDGRSKWSNKIETTHWVLSNALDADNNNWIGTYCGGLGKYTRNDFNWVTKEDLNSNAIYSIDVDNKGNTWIASASGLAVYKEHGVNKKGETTFFNYKFNNIELVQNYPNPCDYSTTIEYIIPESTPVYINVTDILGNEICKLADGYMEQGKHKIELKTESLPQGIYFYSLKTSQTTITKKFIVNR